MEKVHIYILLPLQLEKEGVTMPVKYKIDVLASLKNAGYSTYKLRREKLLGESVIQQLRDGALVSWPNMGRLCHLLNCQPGDILEYEDDSAESATDPEYELVTRFGVAPSVFIGAGNDQSVGLCRRLKHLIVVRLGASAAVLGMEHFGVVLVAHLMQEGGCHVLNRSVQRPGCNVDFPPFLSFNAPR